MNNFDNLFETQTVKPAFDVEQWAKEKNENRQKAYSIIESTSIEVGSNPQTFQKFLDIKSQFEMHSSNNTLLILAQKPEATIIKSPDDWKKTKTKTYITKGEKPLIILEPGKQYERDDGTMGMNYDPKKVFDISQTNYRNTKRKKPVDLGNIIKALLHYSPALVKTTDSLPNNAMSTYNADTNEIHLLKGMSAENIITSLSQEMAHAKIAKSDPDYSREKANFHAYCTAYMMAKKFGLDTSNFDFSSVASVYQGLESQEITKDLSALHAVQKPLCERVNSNLYKIEKEKKQPER